MKLSDTIAIGAEEQRPEQSPLGIARSVGL